MNEKELENAIQNALKKEKESLYEDINMFRYSAVLGGILGGIGFYMLVLNNFENGFLTLLAFTMMISSLFTKRIINFFHEQ